MSTQIEAGASAPANGAAPTEALKSKPDLDWSELAERLERQSGRRDGWSFVVVVLSACSLIMAAIAVGFGARAISESRTSAPAGSAQAAPTNAIVHLSEFKVEPAVVTVASGGTLNVMNMGSVAHNLAIKGTDRATPMLEAGGIGDLPLAGLSAGTYTIYCQVAGHEQAGMQATLKIVETGGDSTAAGPAPTGATQAPAAGAPAMTVAQMDAQMMMSTKAFPAKTAGLGGQLMQPVILADGTKQFELTTSVVKWEEAPGKLVDAWAYNGVVPGPTIKVDPGDSVQVVLHNQLAESTAIHFHGIITPNAMDGVPGITQDPVDPGQTFVYRFTAQSTPAVGMYHSHQDAVKQVPNGLAGAFLIGDEPLPAGVTVAQQQIMMLNDSGTLGLTINGKSFPGTAPVVANLGDWIEVQYLNEGQMIHPMHLHGLAQMVIAKDGYALATPQLEDTVTVAPGERYTVLIHADNPGTWAWHCHILSHAEDSTGMTGMVTALVVKA